LFIQQKSRVHYDTTCIKVVLFQKAIHSLHFKWVFIHFYWYNCSKW